MPINTRGGQLSKCLEMFLFRCKSCSNNIIWCFMKFAGKRIPPVVWAEYLLALNINVLSHHAKSRASFTSKCDRSTSFKIRNRLGCWKLDLVELGFPPFLVPLLLIFSRGNGPKWGTCQLLLRFAPFLLQWYSLLYINHANRVSWWWDMTDWCQKVGCTPRLTRHVPPN